MALNETSVPHKENNCLNYNQTSIKWPPTKRPAFIWQPVPRVLRIFLLNTVIKTSIQWPPLSSNCGQLLAIPTLIYFEFALYLSLLISQEYLKSDIFSQMKVKERQCENVIFPFAFVNIMDYIIYVTIIVLPFSTCILLYLYLITEKWTMSNIFLGVNLY